ncbi:Derlin-2.2 [Diplonema papillatum]|nr:Derlin-2.2 [Diplonema papillatum]
MAQNFEAWWASLGPITKFSLIFPIFLAGCATFQMIDLKQFLLIWPLVSMEPWRIITATFFFGPFSFPFAFNLAFFVIYQKRFEEESYPIGFQGRTADHVWMMFAIMVGLLLIAYFLELVIISLSFAMSIVWVWCKRHEEQPVSFYGFTFKAGYFPWILTVIHVVLGSSPLADIAGIVAGHFYVVTKDVFPETHNFSIMETPHFMYNIFPPSRVGVASVAGTHTMRDADVGARPPQEPHRWGAGRRMN